MRKREEAVSISVDDTAELKRLGAENTEPQAERDVLKRPMVQRVKEATS